MLTPLRYEMNLEPLSKCFFATGRSCIMHMIERYSPTNVILPALVPDGLIAPFEKKGVSVQHYRLNADLSPNLENLHRATHGVRPLIVVVHYFGYCMPTYHAALLAHEHGGLLLEDSAHCLANPDPSFGCADLSLYSLNKVLPVPDGAFMISRSPHVDLTYENTHKLEPLDDTALNAYRVHLSRNRVIAAAPTPKTDEDSEWLRMARSHSNAAYNEYYEGISADMAPRRASELSMRVYQAADFSLILRLRRANGEALVNGLPDSLLFRRDLPQFALPIRCRDAGARLEAVGIMPSVIASRWRVEPPGIEGDFWRENWLIPIHENIKVDEAAAMATAIREMFA